MFNKVNKELKMFWHKKARSYEKPGTRKEINDVLFWAELSGPG